MTITRRQVITWAMFIVVMAWVILLSDSCPEPPSGPGGGWKR